MNIHGEIEKFVHSIQAPNILLIGRTGVGKSSLINAVFGSELAKVGAGLPVTKHFEEFSRSAGEGVPIKLFDSAGFEAGKEAGFVDDTIQFLNARQKLGRKDQIHLAWYVVNAASARFEDFETHLIKRLNADRIPVIIVLSQCDRANAGEISAIKDVINQAQFEKAYDILEVSASPLVVSGTRICEPFGLHRLVERTAELLPKAYVDAFVAAQIVSIEAKRKVAWTYIAATAVACFGAGYIPIPFTTPLVAFISQKELAYRLATLFSYENLEQIGEILRIARSTKEAKIGFLVTAIADIFIWDPISSTIAGATAAGFNLVVGLALAATFEDLAKRHVTGLDRNEIEQILTQVFKEKLDHYRTNITIKSQNDIERFGEGYIQGNL